MTTYTGKQRVVAAFKKSFTGEAVDTDRIPAYPILGQCNAQLIGASVRDYLTDPKVMVKAQVAGYERYRPDIVVMEADLLMEAEAMGNMLRFPEDSTCISTKVALENKGKLSGLTVPDPMKDGRMPKYLEALSEVKKIVGDSVVSGVVAGPWTIAIGLRGASDLIRDAMKDPEYIHELMELCTQVSIRSGEAMHLLVKGGLSYSEAPASCSLISPGIYRTFVFPYHKQIVDHFKEKKVSVGFHVCGYADPILEDIVNTGMTNISIDAPTDMARAVEVTRGKAVLIGNVNTNLFFSGTREQMKEAIKECLALAPKESGYILASGCEVPGVAPPEKIDWFMDLADELGRRFATPEM
jgi:uroporphyrinogen decarboxylase